LNKQKLTLSINKNVLNKARKYDLNISSFLEIRLNEYMSLIEGKELISSNLNNQNKKVLRGRFELPLPRWRTGSQGDEKIEVFKEEIAVSNKSSASFEKMKII